MKSAFLGFALGFVLLTARVARADDPCSSDCSCDSSPENPTLLLAGLAGGVYGANALRARFLAKRNQDDK